MIPAMRAIAGELAAAPPDAWERFNDWSIGDVLFPSLHLHGMGGFSTGDAGGTRVRRPRSAA